MRRWGAEDIGYGPLNVPRAERRMQSTGWRDRLCCAIGDNEKQGMRLGTGNLWVWV